jgi:hypothetical protein|tara:strand:- start:9655 stop:10137 length:483 start_codon:yes stop_codon:yes gene_type:complete
MAENKLADTRSNREATTRDKVERPRSWAPPTLLPDPAPEPGYKYRWIRVSMMGQSDPRNVSTKLREGWEPVRAEDHPEISGYLDNDNARFKDNIVVGGLMLCKTPTEFVDQRNAYYQQQADAQMRSVDNNFMRENDPRMPLFSERKTSVSFGRGNQQSKE